MRHRLAVSVAAICFGGGAVSAETAAPARDGRPLCGPTSTKFKNVKQTRYVRVFTRRERAFNDEQRLFFCRRGRVGTWSLTTSEYTTGQGVEKVIDPFMLVSEGTDSGAPGDYGADLHVVDTRTGRYAITGTAFGSVVGLPWQDLQLSREGHVVWLNTPVAEDGRPTATVSTLGRNGQRQALDSGTQSSDLRLTGRQVTWRQAGEPRSAILGGPPHYPDRLNRARHP